MAENPFRGLPSTAEASAALANEAAGLVSTPILTDLVQDELDRARAAIRAGGIRGRADVLAAVRQRLASFGRPRAAPVINATGVIIHTNLGRAPVSDETADAMARAAAGAVALELRPETNERGGRMDEVTVLMRLLTGAEATLVVNNNAAAILLTLSALATGREVIVSRGEAVEIGGGFRIPDVMRQSGATLVEVGTTNRTYASDYAAAITERTALLLKVHTSNFVISGFTAAPAVEELAAVTREAGVPLVEDLGSGALLDTATYGLASEPTISQRLSTGVDLITASGDKLLGGPQAGIIAGRADLVARIERHPLARAVRADKTCLAGVAATLRHYLRGDAEHRLPVWRMIAATPAELEARGRAIVAALPTGTRERWTVVTSSSTIGGGSLPGQTQESRALAVEGDGVPVDELAKRLRMGTPRIFGHIEGGRLLLDLRTVLPEQDEALGPALVAVIGAPPG